MTTQDEYNPWGDVHQDCPPETPWQLYVNHAIDMMGEKHGQTISELSEGTATLLFDVGVTAANAALEAANVSNDWRAMLDARAHAQPTAPCDHATSKAFPPSWQIALVKSPVDLYREMAWTFQAKEHPELLCGCLGLTEQQKDAMIAIVDAMLAFALIAAGVGGEWDRTYAATVEAMKNRNQDED